MIWQKPLFYPLFILQKCIHLLYECVTLSSAKKILIGLERHAAK
jgi:hypothetical protein